MCILHPCFSSLIRVLAISECLHPDCRWMQYAGGVISRLASRPVEGHKGNSSKWRWELQLEEVFQICPPRTVNRKWNWGPERLGWFVQSYLEEPDLEFRTPHSTSFLYYLVRVPWILKSSDEHSLVPQWAQT